MSFSISAAIASRGAGTTPVLAMDMIAPSAPTIALTTDTGSSNSDGITSNNGVSVSGIEAGATWQYTLDATAGTPTWVTGTGSSFNMTADTTYAINKLGVRQTDAAGNVSTIVKNAAQWVEDSTNPSAPTTLNLADADDTGLNNDNITSNTTGLSIDGVAVTDESIQLYDGATAIGSTVTASSDAFTIDVSLSEGSHTITAKATDLAGNTGVASSPLTVVVDTTAPTAINVTGATAEAGDDLVFTFSEAVDTSVVEPLFTADNAFGDTSATPATVAWNTDHDVATVTLGGGETISTGSTITLTGVADVAGNITVSMDFILAA